MQLGMHEPLRRTRETLRVTSRVVTLNGFDGMSGLALPKAIVFLCASLQISVTSSLLNHNYIPSSTSCHVFSLR
jgi:hypothetical protein